MLCKSYAAVLAAALVAVSARPCAAGPCEELSDFKANTTAITVAQVVAAGDMELPMPPPFPPRNVHLPAHCRVAGVISPTRDSTIGFELWMPASGWNGRYQQVGNGGLAGHIEFAEMAGVLLHGSATLSTDDGHVTANAFEGKWAIGHPEKLIDYGYRAVHLAALVGKELTRRYYGKKEAHSYFVGCSGGGRESLMEAQRYPEDFDGYLVGAPGIDIANGAVSYVHTQRMLAALEPGQQLIPMHLKALASRVLDHCDAMDGITDGVIQDPRKCKFSPEELKCSGEGGGNCLTAAQANAIAGIYSGPRDARTGAQVAPGNFGTLGTEDRTWFPVLIGGPGMPSLGSVVAAGTIGELLYGDGKFDMMKADLVQVARDANSRLAPIMNPSNPDLSRAQALRRKIIHFHGWADPNIPPQYSIEYFDAVQRKMGPGTSDFYRLFLVPAMPHCGSTPGLGANFVGLTGGIVDELPQLSGADYNWTAALERWVEQGVAPDRMIGSEFAVDLSGPRPPAILPTTPVKSTRPICPYPQVASYDGVGVTTVAASFACKVP